MERLDSLSRDELIQIILDQQRLIEQLRAEIEQLKRRGVGSAIFQGSHKPNPSQLGGSRDKDPFVGLPSRTHQHSSNPWRRWMPIAVRDVVASWANAG